MLQEKRAIPRLNMSAHRANNLRETYSLFVLKFCPFLHNFLSLSPFNIQVYLLCTFVSCKELKEEKKKNQSSVQTLSKLTVRRGVRQIPADAGRAAALAIAGPADPAVSAAAAAIAGLAAGGSSGTRADARVAHGHAEFGDAQRRLRIHVGNDAAASATAAAAAASAAATSGAGSRGAVHAATRKRHQGLLIAQTDPAAAAAFRQLTLQLH